MEYKRKLYFNYIDSVNELIEYKLESYESDLQIVDTKIKELKDKIFIEEEKREELIQCISELKSFLKNYE